MTDAKQISAKEISVIVVGGGPAGLTAAVALAEAGVPTALIGRRLAAPDNRTTALLDGSVNALKALGVWEACADHAAPLRVMRIVDDTARLWRAPEVKFDADEIGLEAFGYNIENRHLVTALEQKTRDLSTLRVIDGEAAALDFGAREITIHLKDGTSLSAPLIIGADGRKSLVRDAAGITMKERHHPQSALTVCFTHSRPHRDTSTEFHSSSGPFTLVPLPGLRSSLVFVLDRADVTRIAELDDAALSSEIERRSHSILGKITVEKGRGLFPLASGTASALAANRIALVGEAAHVIPPIGAQGLNLGLRDAAAIGEMVASAYRQGADVGAPQLLARYCDERRADITTRSAAVDLLNRSLLSDFLPVQGARGLGLYLIDRIGPLRRALMREGVTPSSKQPRLMRGEAL